MIKFFFLKEVITVPVIVLLVERRSKIENFLKTKNYCTSNDFKTRTPFSSLESNESKPTFIRKGKITRISCIANGNYIFCDHDLIQFVVYISYYSLTLQP